MYISWLAGAAIGGFLAAGTLGILHWVIREIRAGKPLHPLAAYTIGCSIIAVTLSAWFHFFLPQPWNWRAIAAMWVVGCFGGAAVASMYAVHVVRDIRELNTRRENGHDGQD